MANAVAALDACVEDLVRSWGFDPDTQANLSRPPTPLSNPGRWIDPKTYPYQQLREGQGAILDFRLTVDAQGMPQDCTVQNTVGDPIFVKLTCDELMRRARFEPALDVAGTPVRSLWFNRVLFQS